jgi:hypothetical protein
MLCPPTQNGEDMVEDGDPADVDSDDEPDDELDDELDDGAPDAADTYQGIGERLNIQFDDDIGDSGTGVSTTNQGVACLAAEIITDLEKFQGQPDDIPYSFHVSAFLTWLLHVPSQPITVKPGNKVPSSLTCALCEVDPTIPPDEQRKVWLRNSRLLRHQLSTVHTGYAHWYRQMHTKHPDNRFLCPYPECPKEGYIWTHLVSLKNHIISAGRSFTNDNHACKIRQD